MNQWNYGLSVQILEFLFTMLIKAVSWWKAPEAMILDSYNYEERRYMELLSKYL